MDRIQGSCLSDLQIKGSRGLRRVIDIDMYGKYKQKIGGTRKKEDFCLLMTLGIDISKELQEEKEKLESDGIQPNRVEIPKEVAKLISKIISNDRIPEDVKNLNGLKIKKKPINQQLSQAKNQTSQKKKNKKRTYLLTLDLAPGARNTTKNGGYKRQNVRELVISQNHSSLVQSVLTTNNTPSTTS